MIEKKFKNAAKLKEHFITSFVMIVILLFLIILLVISMFLPKGLNIILGGFLILVILMVIVGFLISFFSTRTIAKLNDKGLQVPINGFGGAFFEENTKDGYFVDKRKLLIISSSYENIIKCWRVTNPDEIANITTDRKFANVDFRISLNGTSLRVEDIGSLIKGLKNDNFRKELSTIILKLFKYNHTYVPEKSVAVQFKKMSANCLMGKVKSEYLKKIIEAYEKQSPVLEDPVFYFSVDDPDNFVRELNLRLNQTSNL